MSITTGIKGFDRLVQGGIPKGFQVLLTGTPGTGKTIFSLEYIYRGAKEHGEKGLYVTFEENAESLKAQAEQFGWDFSELEKNGLATIKSIPADEITDTVLSELKAFIEKNSIKRLVIDSITSLAINMPATRTDANSLSDLHVKRHIYHFINQLRSLHDTTAILISQATSALLSLDGVSEFICDGVIQINYASLGGEYTRSLSIRKMRQVKNIADICPVEISSHGIIIHTIDD